MITIEYTKRGGNGEIFKIELKDRTAMKRWLGENPTVGIVSIERSGEAMFKYLKF